LRHSLGIEVARGSRGLLLSQRKYVREIIDESELLGVKPVDFPRELNEKLALAKGLNLNDRTKYRHRWLMYFTITRLELSYALSQFMHKPKE